MSLTVDVGLNEPQTPAQRLAHMHWPLLMLLCVLAGIGVAMLISVAGGNPNVWAIPHAVKFGIGMVILFLVAMIDIEFWQRVALPIYVATLLTLVALAALSAFGFEATRWLEFGGVRLQPSEPMKVALVLVLAALYAAAHEHGVPRFLTHLFALILIAIPVALILRQPDLGTAALTALGGLSVMFLAGLSYLFITLCVILVLAGIVAVFVSRGTSWQLLENYQYERIDVFLDPGRDPLGVGYHMVQSQIAFGSGGLWGAGFMQGPQSYLNFLPEKHTDFVFATLAEEFGFVGTVSVLALHVLILALLAIMAYRMQSRFTRLLAGGLTCVFFIYFSVNMGMIVGLLPIVGVPLPLVSHGGSAMLTMLVAMGLLQSARMHRDPERTW